MHSSTRRLHFPDRFFECQPLVVDEADSEIVDLVARYFLGE